MHSTPSEGTVVAGRYELVALIGEGGMARIWRAKDLTLHREVAVKFLFMREDRHRTTMLDRFLREARIAAAVRHPNVVDILDFGSTDDGRPFMVMELLRGHSLEERLAHEPALTIEELVTIAAGMLDGLAAVHKAGIVHRDVKPDNIFLLDDGDVRTKLLDFGVSRDLGDPTSGRRSALTTNDGYLVGTPEYMSPEQARGLKDVDARSDIYGAGVVLYEAMTGQLPYRADAVGDLIIDIVGGGAPAMIELRPEIGERLSTVVAKAMSVSREARYQNAREMRDALLDAAEASLGLGVRASLPIMAPARIVVPDAASAAKKATAASVTLDEREVVHAPSAPPRTIPWAWVAVACAIPIAAAGVWYGTRAPDRVAARTPAVLEPAALASSPPDEEREELSISTPAPVAEPSPQPEHVRVTLRDLPSRARVRVDRAWVEHDDGAITLARDGRPHELTVVAPGRRPWSTTYTAQADGEYEVPAPAPRAAAPAPSAPATVFRELDY